MNETAFLDSLIAHGWEVTIRLCEGREIQAVPVAQDGISIVVRRSTGDEALIFKKAISVITPIKPPGG